MAKQPPKDNDAPHSARARDNAKLRARMDEEARISEAAAYDDSDADAPLPAHVKVSRPNRPSP
ncbi:hypothetical protein L2K20_06100 [Mycobacterium sp. MBM]|nr:hypothetical protein [Mycobacterium sp. MBM]